MNLFIATQRRETRHKTSHRFWLDESTAAVVWQFEASVVQQKLTDEFRRCFFVLCSSVASPLTNAWYCRAFKFVLYSSLYQSCQCSSYWITVLDTAEPWSVDTVLTKVASMLELILKNRCAVQISFAVLLGIVCSIHLFCSWDLGVPGRLPSN